MKLKTVRVRRSRPSALALSLALMLTMLCVYILSLSSLPEAQTAAARAEASAEVRLPGLDVHFQCAGRYASSLEARVTAARCAQAGGAGLVLPDGDGYAVIFQAVGEAGESSIARSAGGLALRLKGAAGEVSALSDAAAFLHALASETGALAAALESGETTAASIASLMQVYRTQGERAQNGLIAIEAGSPVVSALLQQVENALPRLDCASAQPSTARLRHLHAAACADYLFLLEELHSMV